MRRGSGRALLTLCLFLMLALVPSAFGAERTPGIANRMPLNPDLNVQGGLSGVNTPILRTESSFASRGGRVLNSVRGAGAPCEQTVKAIVILVKFTDNPPGGPTTRYFPALFDSMLFGSTYVRGGADPTTNRTLKNFYHEVSYGAVDIVTLNLPGAIGWVTAPHSYTYYAQNDGTHDNGFGPYPRNAQRLVMDAVLAADPYVDFSKYAVGGVVQNLFVVHAGSGAEWNGYSTLVWSHAWNIDTDDGYGTTPPALYADGVKISGYSMEPECGGNTTGEGGSVTGPYLPTVGVYAHEFGHVLGLPDEYDYGYESNGTGRYSLMAGGSWSRSPNVAECAGNSPAHPSAWGVAKLGFVTPVLITTSLVGAQIPPIETTKANALYKLVNPASSGKEYWLIENRQQLGFDQGFVQMSAEARGLLIYHVDENVLDRTYWRPNEAECAVARSYRGAQNCDCNGQPVNLKNGEKWYGISIEQADGKYELEAGTSIGHAPDFYNSSAGKTAFTSSTTPNNTSYYGCTASAYVLNISGTTGTLTADFYGPSACQVTPSDIDFGSVGLGSTADTTFTIANLGGGTLSGTVGPAGDQISIISGEGSYTLGAGEHLDVTARFGPTTEGAHGCSVQTGALLCGTVSLSGSGAVESAVESPQSGSTPASFFLSQNHPNPMSPGTEIVYGLPVDGHMRLEIYDVQGHRVNTLVDRQEAAGIGTAHWDGRNGQGLDLPSGIYFYRMEAKGFSAIRRLILVR